MEGPLSEERKTGEGMCYAGRIKSGGLLFFFKFTFNWRIIALQCCVGFSVQQLSQSKVYIYPL